MQERKEYEPAVVVAAMGGDQRAIDELVAACLPLVYNVVGRAMDVLADVDDVVQETMLHVVRGLPGLRDPARFRSWLVAIAVREVSTRARVRNRTLPHADLDTEVADPGADFVDLTIAKLGLQGQRREVAQATRWLDADDRQLLSLWWLEAAGELTRTELADTLGLTPHQAAVRVQRMKAQLDAARAVVRALRASGRCPELAHQARHWDGRPSTLWRKRFARHTRECLGCAEGWSELVPADRLLTGLVLVPLPIGFALRAARPVIAGSVGANGVPSAGWFARLGSALASKPAAAAVVTALVLGGGVVAVYDLRPSTAATTGATAAWSATPAQASPSPTRLSASPSARPSASPSATKPGASPSASETSVKPTRTPTTRSTRHFPLLPASATLPSGAWCASAVRAIPVAENKADNATANRTVGAKVPGATGRLSRVDGNFTGTTEQILRWAACKWGIDEDMVKAQTAIESWWHMSNKGDWGTDASRCPANHGLGVDGKPGTCPESYGLLQVRYPYNMAAFPAAEKSSAMNADFAYGVWRECYEGRMTWLNTVERGSKYAAGDAWGCMGVHLSGRWHTAAAEGYIARVKGYLAQRIWKTPNFQQP